LFAMMVPDDVGMESKETTESALRHASELYARLLEYAISPPFGERTAANVRRVTAMRKHHHGGHLCRHHQGGRVLALAAAQIVFDAPPLGMRLIDRYADWSADLTDRDRRLLDAWRTGDVHAVFEITRRAGAGVRARCLGDDLEYTLYLDPRTPMRREDLRTGRYILGHTLPVGESWMLVGALDLHAPRDRRAMLGVMAELIRAHRPCRSATRRSSSRRMRRSRSSINSSCACSGDRVRRGWAPD
jgi:hypothetical protein